MKKHPIPRFWLPSLATILAAMGSGCSEKATPVSVEPSTSSANTPKIAPNVEAIPFSPPGAPGSSQTLFETVSPDKSGVNFTHPLDTTHPLKRLFAYGYAVGGVAIGDLDGDGRPDLFFANGPENNGLFLQTAPWKFTDNTSASGVGGGESWATGAAMVDIDNDGDLDLYVCNYDSPNQLFINDGKAGFTEQAAAFGLDHTNASLMPTFCDYDRDGDLDLYILTNMFVREGGQPEDAVFRQNGEPRMKSEYKKWYDVRFAGVRGENLRHEIYPVGQRDRLFRNDSDPAKGVTKFTDVSDYSGSICAVAGKGLSATWWDYNEDGWPDLYVGNDFEDGDHLYRNNGPLPDGRVTFTDVIKETVPHTTWYSMGADVGDVNNDGRLDFLSVDMAATTHFKQKASMGDMGSKTWFMTTAEPRQIMRNALLINTGTPRFQEAAFLTGLANSDWSWSPEFGDYDSDGRIDLFVTNGMSRPFTESDIIKNIPNGIRVGKTDWELFEQHPPQKEKNLAFVNRGDLEFENTANTWGLDHEGMSYSSAKADLDGDGHLDLVVGNLDEPVSLYRNRGGEGNRITIELRGSLGPGTSNHFGTGAVVTVESTSVGLQVRQMQPMGGFLGSDEPALHFGLGRDTEISKLKIRWPSGRRQLLTNLPANHRFTITEPEDSSPQLVPPDDGTNGNKPFFTDSKAMAPLRHRERGYNDFHRQSLLPHKHSQLGPAIAFADIDGDGDADAFIGGAAGQAGAVVTNNNGEFTRAIRAPFEPDAASEDMGALFFDADSDGDLDLYVVSGSVECEPGDERLRDRLYTNQGRGRFSLAPADSLPDLRESGSTVVAADYDKDGDLDLFVGGRVVPGNYPTSPASHLLQNNSGKFTDVTGSLAPALKLSGMVTSALWSDADGDGWVDLLVTYEWGPVRFWKNQQGESLEDQTDSAGLAGLTGWWNAINGGDFDGDGDTDFIVTNAGLNTKYHASAEAPALIYYGDFEGDGKPRIIEAEYENDILFPGRGKSCSTRAIPNLAEKFQTFRDFAQASLVEIYPEDRLASAQRFAATTLQSGILINESNGQAKFSFKPLPRIAQIAPTFGCAVLDFDADGILDIALAQNFWSPQLETGRMDGGIGQLLRGNGDGSFAPVPPATSGIVVPGDAKAVAVVDLKSNGTPDLVFTVNDGLVRAFENQQPEGSYLPVTVSGSLATVTASTENGSEIRQTLFSSTGYLSQSAPTAYFAQSTPNGRVTGVSVHWSDGTESKIAVAPEKTTLNISKPKK